MKTKGSVTLFISLLMAVILGVFQVLFQSLRIAGGRVQAEAGVEEGLYSVFSDYNRELFDRYRVFFLDGGYGSGEFSPGIMISIVEDSLKQSCFAGKRENLWNCSYETAAITGYTLATDQQGRPFREQAVGYMKDTLGIQGIQLLADQLQQQKKTAEEQEIQGGYENAREAQDEYEKKKEEKQRQDEEDRKHGDVSAANAGESGTSQVEVPDDFQNPLDTIRQVQKMGLLGLVVPADMPISQETISLEEQPSRRSLKNGIGVPAVQAESSAMDDLLFLQYMVEILGCYGEEKTENGLRYQLEYVIGGKHSDQENLKKTVQELLAVRTAANMVHLLTDSVKQTQVHQMAVIIASAVALPFLEGIISLALQGAWAFGESVLDIRCLLKGGNVPLVKSSESWKLSLENLGNILEVLNQEEGKEKAGMDYQEYLRLLLFMKGSQSRLDRTIDLAEQEMRAGGQENFRMDLCVYALEAEMEIQCEDQKFLIMRSYGYGM